MSPPTGSDPAMTLSKVKSGDAPFTLVASPSAGSEQALWSQGMADLGADLLLCGVWFDRLTTKCTQLIAIVAGWYDRLDTNPSVNNCNPLHQ